MSGMDRGSSDRGQGCECIISAGRIRFQQSAQPGMTVPGTKLALPTVVTVEATMGIAQMREGCSWIGLKEWSNFPDVSSSVSIAVIKHHEPKQAGEQGACFRSQLSGHIPSLRDGQGKDSKQGLSSKS